MSGIAGFVNLDGRPAEPTALAAMTGARASSGVHSVGHRLNAAAALGCQPAAHLSAGLMTPLVHEPSGCVITAHARLDNRGELTDRLGASIRADIVDGFLPGDCVAADAALILAAYLVWGRSCVDRLLGDFAFAVWEPRTRRLFGARDHFGVRPFYYAWMPGKQLAFASTAGAILALPDVSPSLNAGRIADFLVPQLEGVDMTSTFYTGVHRLPPAHTLELRDGRLLVERYWRLIPEDGAACRSDDDYDDEFRHRFSLAVHCRLGSGRGTAATLSGGMDSGAVVAVARTQLAQEGAGPLRTYSAVSSASDNCVETHCIRQAAAMPNLSPIMVRDTDLGAFMPALGDLTWSVDEPFDYHMVLPRLLYLAAERNGDGIMLDGLDGDTVLSPGTYIARLMRAGKLRRGWHETRSRAGEVDPGRPWIGDFVRFGLSAYAPATVRRRQWATPVRKLLHRTSNDRADSLISPAFAREIRLDDRLAQLRARRAPGLSVPLSVERAAAMMHPYLTVGLERYHRVASTAGIELRHPFLDLRLAGFCVSLPGDQKRRDGLSKVILRRTMAGLLPDDVIRRQSKEHLGWTFLDSVMRFMAARVHRALDDNRALLAPYVDLERLQQVQARAADDAGARALVYDVAQLGNWLARL